MRKSSKVILTLTGMFFALGLVLVVVGFLSGGKFKSITVFGKELDYIDMEETFDKQKITSLEIDVDADNISIVEGSEFRIVGTNVVKNSISTGVRGNTLYIKENRRNWYERIGLFIHTRDTKITLYVPSDFVAEYTDLEVDAGELNIEKLTTGTLKMYISAGKADLANVTVTDEAKMSVGAGGITGEWLAINNLDVDVDAGACKLSGAFYKNIKLECDAGSIRLDTSLTEDEYNYDLDRDVGSVKVNNNAYNDYKNRNNNAENDIEADCSVGSINIRTR